MKVGINGMGRMGRLVLRAAFGGIHRPESDLDHKIVSTSFTSTKSKVELKQPLTCSNSTAYMGVGMYRSKLRMRNRLPLVERKSDSASLEIRVTLLGAISAATSCSNAPASF